MSADELPEEEEFPQVVNLQQAQVDTIRAEWLRAASSALGQVSCSEADLNQTLTGQMQAETLRARQSAFGVVKGQSISAEECALGLARAETLHLNGRAIALYARETQAENVSAGVVSAARLEAGSLRAGVVLAREIHGPVQTWFSLPQALAAGAACGLVFGLMSLAGRLLKGKK